MGGLIELFNCILFGVYSCCDYCKTVSFEKLIIFLIFYEGCCFCFANSVWEKITHETLPPIWWPGKGGGGVAGGLTWAGLAWAGLAGLGWGWTGLGWTGCGVGWLEVLGGLCR